MELRLLRGIKFECGALADAMHAPQNLTVFLICLLFALTGDRSVLSANAKEPLWYQYILAGRASFKTDRIAASVKYYSGALEELDKIAEKEKKPVLSASEKKVLRILYREIDAPFSKQFSDYNLNNQKKLLAQAKRGAMANPATAAAGRKSTRAYYQAMARRKHRVAKIYKALLGNRDPATVHATEMYNTFLRNNQARLR